MKEECKRENAKGKMQRGHSLFFTVQITSPGANDLAL
jgi:hypothetical protein